MADLMADPMRFERRMSDADALMWRNEKDPMLRSTIIAVAILDRPPDHQRLMRRLERTTRVVPRLRQRVVHSPLSIAPPRWEVDPNSISILAQFPFGPMSGAATNLTLLSYQDQVHVAINTDPAALPDTDTFVACLEDGFDEIRKLA
jgi:hypothetical protein